MEKHEDSNVGCPKCGSTIFDNTNGVVLRSVYSEAAHKRYVHKCDLVRCVGCASLIQVLDDGELVIVEKEPVYEIKKIGGETDDADKSPS